MIKARNLLFLLSCIFLFFPLTARANTFIGNNNGPTLNEQTTLWADSINGLAPTVSLLFSSVFTIMFLAGVVRMGYSIITKTGQVMKGSTGILIWVPVTFFFIRILILIMFTTDSKNVTLLASDIISLIKTTGYFTSVGMILMGLVLFLFYKLIEHPEYGRWSKRLWVTAALLTLLTMVTPWVLGAV